MPDEGIRPGIAHALPEQACARLVAVGGGEVRAALAAGGNQPLVACDAVFASQVGMGGVDMPLGSEHGLEVVLFLRPAGGADGVAVGADQGVVVLAHAPLAPWQWPPGLATQPGREAGVVLPAPQARVAGRLVHLVNRLQPGAAPLFQAEHAPAPTIAAQVLDDRAWLIRPVLTPVLDHHRLAGHALCIDDAHLQDVHEADHAVPSPAVLVDVDLLRAPGLVGGARRLLCGRRCAIAVDLEEIETDAVGARHREDGAAVTLQRTQARRLQGFPGLAGPAVQRDGRAVGRAATRLGGALVEWP